MDYNKILTDLKIFKNSSQKRKLNNNLFDKSVSGFGSKNLKFIYNFTKWNLHGEIHKEFKSQMYINCNDKYKTGKTSEEKQELINILFSMKLDEVCWVRPFFQSNKDYKGNQINFTR